MPRIPETDIERLKSRIDLLALIQSRGVALKKRGGQYVACCPFHEEKTPSFTVTPAKGLWHCLGCNQGGDAIRFVELIDKITILPSILLPFKCSRLLGGQHLFSSLFSQLGYQGPVDGDQRLWFVNLASTAK